MEMVDHQLSIAEHKIIWLNHDKFDYDVVMVAGLHISFNFSEGCIWIVICGI